MVARCPGYHGSDRDQLSGYSDAWLAYWQGFLLDNKPPAIIAIAYTGFCFAYAIINAEEVNRRFRSGDLTYFGADIAFGGSLLLGGLWLFLTYTGHQWGREDHRSV